MKKISIIILFSVIAQISFSQQKYFVFFTDKAKTTFNPYEYFDQKAIDRRIKNNISLFDSTDFPLNQDYVTKVSEQVEEVTSQTRWFNAVAVWAYEEQISVIENFYFVKSIEPIYSQSEVAQCQYDTSLIEDDKDLLKNQLMRMQGNQFVENEFDGTGIRIAVFDIGFPGVDYAPAFESIRDESRIIKTWDFVNNKEDVYHGNHHGTMVMSCIAGKIGDKQIGLATGAEFLLARTETFTEFFSEEENWLAAVEWADKNGADIINSSLGYTHHRYFTYQMDGKTSLVSRAANLAAKKGILVVNAMGNDGNSDWKFVGTPADADSILSIGGTNPDTDYHTSFSSFGPTFDNRMKPNVVAYGHAIVATESGLEESQGTSFSSPLVAGFAACAWQSRPKLTNMEMKREIEMSGDLFPYYDYAHGYGVPQASYFTEENISAPDTTFRFEHKNNFLYIMIDDEYIENYDYTQNNYLFYHIENDEGYLDKYYLIDVFQKEAIKIDLDGIDKKSKIVAHFKGYTASLEQLKEW